MSPLPNTIFRNTDAWQPLPILKFSKIGCNLGDNYPASVPAMTLHFPNQSRSFDEAKGCIRFIGHDDVFEVVFRLEGTSNNTALTQSGLILAGHEAL